MRDESRRVIAALQARYAETTAVRTLKIRHNNVLGYFVEVTAQHGDKLMSPPLNATFIHRQTLAGQVRFTTTELGELEAKIASAADRALGIELETFERLVGNGDGGGGRDQGRRPKRWRCSTSPPRLAELAVERRLRAAGDRRLARFRGRGRPPSGGGAGARPTAGRSSPTIATSRLPPRAADGRIYLLTGPNMAGKSTYSAPERADRNSRADGQLRAGAPRPIGVVDRLFSRVGAADDIARGRSTFMVEMVETAAILNQAGERSLVILDEIGRGTATFDGLSIAWATIEHLHETNRCRALFATHFHELTALAAKLPRLFNATMRVKEWQGEVVFLHEVVPGAADRSYGIQVAKLAGLPAAVIERAKLVLAKLEAEDRASPRGFEDLPLFAAAPRPTGGAADGTRRSMQIMAALAALHPDQMSPREALEALYELKAKAAAKDEPQSPLRGDDSCARLAAASGALGRCGLLAQGADHDQPARPIDPAGIALRPAPAQAQSYPSRTITMVVTAAGRRRDRRGGARHRPAPVGEMGPAGRDREPRRRRTHPGRASRRQGRARRPYPDGGRGRDLRDQSQRLSPGQAELRR